MARFSDDHFSSVSGDEDEEEHVPRGAGLGEVDDLVGFLRDEERNGQQQQQQQQQQQAAFDTPIENPIVVEWEKILVDREPDIYGRSLTPDERNFCFFCKKADQVLTERFSHPKKKLAEMSEVFLVEDLISLSANACSIYEKEIRAPHNALATSHRLPPCPPVSWFRHFTKHPTSVKGLMRQRVFRLLLHANYTEEKEVYSIDLSGQPRINKEGYRMMMECSTTAVKLLNYVGEPKVQKSAMGEGLERRSRRRRIRKGA